MRNFLIITSLLTTGVISAPQGTNPNLPSMNMAGMPSPPSIPAQSDKVPPIKLAVMPKNDKNQDSASGSKYGKAPEPEPSPFSFDFTDIFGFISQLATKEGQEKIIKDIKSQADSMINQYADQVFTIVGDTVESRLPGFNSDLFSISNGLKAFGDLASLFGFDK